MSWGLTIHVMDTDVVRDGEQMIDTITSPERKEKLKDSPETSFKAFLFAILINYLWDRLHAEMPYHAENTEFFHVRKYLGEQR